jgi:hypothetical protein
MESFQLKLPTGRWIYCTDNPNSKGNWFFIGEPVTIPHNPVATANNTIMANQCTQTDPDNQLSSHSTETLIEELMRRSPEEQKKLILQSIGDTSNKVPSESRSTITSPPATSPRPPLETTDEDPHSYTLESISQQVAEKLKQQESTPSRSTLSNNSITSVKGLNEPNIYLPSIQIPPPQQDPERIKSKKRQHVPEYDPSHPKMDKRYTTLRNGPEKTFVCKDCHRTFGNKGSFTRHYRATHTTDHYECLECGLSTTRKDSLRIHYSNKHPEINFDEDPLIRKHQELASKKPKFNIKPKHTLKDLKMKGNISPTLLTKLQATIDQHH